MIDYPTLEQFVGNTPLVRLQRINPNRRNVVLLKLEGNNPAGSVKDRPAMSMISQMIIRSGTTMLTGLKSALRPSGRVDRPR